MTDFDVTIRQVDPRDARAILRTTLAADGQSPAEIEAHVTLFLQYARDMQLTPATHWQAEKDGRTVGACTCLESPGRTAMLFLPDGRLNLSPPGVISRLAATVVEELLTRDVNLIQCLLAPNDESNTVALRRAGFHELAELLYLEWNATIDVPISMSPIASVSPRLTWATYDVNTENEFREVIAASYVGSLDCPSLSQLRSIEDTMTSHKAAGRFDPTQWLLLRENGRAIGCNLLCENPLRPILEIVYMGVHPDARGKGHARRLLRTGLSLAHHAGFTRVTLAVDAGNSPALHLYRSEGFHETMRRRAFIRSIAPTSRAI